MYKVTIERCEHMSQLNQDLQMCHYRQNSPLIETNALIEFLHDRISSALEPSASSKETTTGSTY